MEKRPKLSELQKYIKPLVAERWEDIGIGLMLADEDDGRKLDEIGKNKKDNGERFMAVMKLWLRSKSTSPVTWYTLHQCLRHNGLGEAVKAVENIAEVRMVSSQGKFVVCVCVCSV